MSSYAVNITRSSIKTTTLATLLAVAAALVLPQLFHLLGATSGLGTGLGRAFLPMYLPVLAVGFMAGPIAGAATGLLAPLVSYAATGMPLAVSLPFLLTELVICGLVAGLLRNRNWPTIGSIILVQIAGKLGHVAAVGVAILLGNQGVSLGDVPNALLIGLPGILLQWALLPLIMYWWRSRHAN